MKQDFASTYIQDYISLRQQQKFVWGWHYFQFSLTQADFMAKYKLWGFTCRTAFVSEIASKPILNVLSPIRLCGKWMDKFYLLFPHSHRCLWIVSQYCQIYINADTRLVFEFADRAVHMFWWWAHHTGGMHTFILCVKHPPYIHRNMVTPSLRFHCENRF